MQRKTHSRLILIAYLSNQIAKYPVKILMVTNSSLPISCLGNRQLNPASSLIIHKDIK